MPPILGFQSQAERTDHFDRHVTQGREFAFADEGEYEAAAIAFMDKTVDGVVIKEHLRLRDNTTVRFDSGTREICFVHDGTYIGSYFKVRERDAEAYFRRRCT